MASGAGAFPIEAPVLPNFIRGLQYPAKSAGANHPGISGYAIPDIRRWLSRDFGDLTYYTSHVHTGHGNFQTSLAFIKKAPGPMFILCSRGEEDDVEHTVIPCRDDWEAPRTKFGPSARAQNADIGKCLEHYLKEAGMHPQEERPPNRAEIATAETRHQADRPGALYSIGENQQDRCQTFANLKENTKVEVLDISGGVSGKLGKLERPKSQDQEAKLPKNYFVGFDLVTIFETIFRRSASTGVLKQKFRHFSDADIETPTPVHILSGAQFRCKFRAVLCHTSTPYLNISAAADIDLNVGNDSTDLGIQ